MTIWGLIIGGATGLRLAGQSEPYWARSWHPGGITAAPAYRPEENKKVAFTVAVIALSAKWHAMWFGDSC